MRRPSGDHTGEMIGSLERSRYCARSPSASAICSSKAVPRFTT